MERGVVDLAPVVIAVILGVPLAVLWAFALADVLQRADSEFPSWRPGSNDRIVWAFVVLVFAGIGALVYYFKVMKPYPRQRR